MSGIEWFKVLNERGMSSGLAPMLLASAATNASRTRKSVAPAPLLFYVDLPRRISTIFRGNDRPSPLLLEPETRLANLTLGVLLE